MPTTYWFDFEGERYTKVIKDGSKAKPPLYASVWRDHTEEATKVSWHTSLEASWKATDRPRYGWLHKTLLGTADVFSDAEGGRKPSPIYDGYEISISLGHEQIEAWKNTFGLAHDRNAVVEDIRLYFEGVVKDAIKTLPILREIEGINVTIRRSR